MGRRAALRRDSTEGSLEPVEVLEARRESGELGAADRHAPDAVGLDVELLRRQVEDERALDAEQVVRPEGRDTGGLKADAGDRDRRPGEIVELSSTVAKMGPSRENRTLGGPTRPWSRTVLTEWVIG